MLRFIWQTQNNLMGSCRKLELAFWMSIDQRTNKAYNRTIQPCNRVSLDKTSFIKPKMTTMSCFNIENFRMVGCKRKKSKSLTDQKLRKTRRKVMGVKINMIACKRNVTYRQIHEWFQAYFLAQLGHPWHWWKPLEV